MKLLKVLHRRQRGFVASANQIWGGRERLRQRLVDAVACGGDLRQFGNMPHTNRQQCGLVGGEHGRQHALRHLRSRLVFGVHRVRNGQTRRHPANHRLETI